MDTQARAAANSTFNMYTMFTDRNEKNDILTIRNMDSMEVVSISPRIKRNIAKVRELRDHAAGKTMTYGDICKKAEEIGCDVGYRNY